MIGTQIQGTELHTVMHTLAPRVKQRSHYTNSRLALFNAWKHTHTNYVRVVTGQVYVPMEGFEPAKAQLKSIYQQLFRLCEPQWRPEVQMAYNLALIKLKKHYAEYAQYQREAA